MRSENVEAPDLGGTAPLGEVDGRGTGVGDLLQLLEPGDGLHLLPGPGVQVGGELPDLTRRRGHHHTLDMGHMGHMVL